MYLQMNNGELVREAVGNIVWSPNHFQTAESLSAEERTEFNLYLVVDDQPVLLSTQKWGAHTYVVSGATVTRTWNPVDKTVEEIDAEAAAAYAASVPVEVTMRQARLALLGAGVLASVQAAVEAMDEPLRSAVIIEWEYASTVERNGPVVQMLAPLLGLTALQIDGLFTAAATL